MNLFPVQEVLDPVSEEPVVLTNEMVRWRARDATFLAGKWAALSKRIPRFVVEDFKATADGPANPHIRTVVRLRSGSTNLNRWISGNSGQDAGSLVTWRTGVFDEAEIRTADTAHA